MNSALNPEAPEFYPHLTSVTQDGYSTMNKTIRSANHLPSGASHIAYKTFTDFNSISSQISKNVVVQSNQIVVKEIPAVKLKYNDNEQNTEVVIDVNDSFLDRVNINIDRVCGVNQGNETFLSGIRPGINVSSWNKNPVIAKIQMGTATFIGAKNIPRPQLTFKDTIDNSDSLWVPKISDKPNNIKPLALNIIFNDQGEAVGYEHPYLVELDLYQPAEELIDPDPAPPAFPPPLDRTRLTFIETEAQLDELVRHLNDVQEIAVDLEHHSYRTYQGMTCLIQITTNEGGDFIVDALAVREHMYKLNAAFTDPRKLKVFHGAEMDVLWLQRDFGVYIVGLFDTHQAAKVLNTNGRSLKYLLMKYCGVNADKKYQLADWRIRPLPEELVEYARQDTHYLLHIWRKMKAELLAVGAGKPQLLRSVFEQSRQICLTTYNKAVVDDSSHLQVYVRSKKAFNTQQMAALKMLYKWRDAQARALDESTMYLLPNHMMLALAETLPREINGVHACCNPMPPFVKQNIITIHRMILSCRELPMEPQLYQMPTSIRNMVNLHHSFAFYLNQAHDFSNIELSGEPRCNIENLFADEVQIQPYRIHAFAQTYGEVNYGVVSDLNVDAKNFIPPYDRYRKYRAIAQMEELKDFKEKETKISALTKGDDLIKTEVLLKIQQAKSQVENEDEPQDADAKDRLKIGEKRKRKISTEKQLDENNSETQTQKVDSNQKKTETSKDEKPIYKNVDYRKFYDVSERTHNHKQPKMKFKKHRK